MHRKSAASQEDLAVGSDSSSQGNDDEDKDGEVSNVVSASELPREPEELDCVQNLLSLSQGAWQQ